MKTSIKNPVKIGMLLASFMLVCGMAFGTTYTASVSGNWSNSATWGGTAPPFTLAVGDVVIVPLTFTVTMDQNVTVNGTVEVLGTLSALPYIKLNVNSGGTIMGAGSINAARVTLNTGGVVTFTGAITADTIINAMATLSTSAQVTFFNELNLSGALTLSTAGVLTAGSNSNITISGGSILLSGGTLALTADYSVNYITASTIAGLELGGTGLGIVTIAVPSADTVTLSSDVIMDNTLKFTSGVLKLNGFNLTTSSQITGNVAIAGNILSSIIVNTTTGLTNAIDFVSGFQNLNNLTVNVGSGNSVAISSGLTVNGILAISTGSMFNISNEALTVVGDLTGTGTLMVNAASKLAFTGISSITGDISLSGIALGKLTENLGVAKTLNMATALNVDTLSLMSGTLLLDGNNLAIYGDVTAAGTGLILSTSASKIYVTTANAVTGPLSFSALGDSVKDLIVTIANNGAVKLGSDLNIKDTLNFVIGYVDIDTNNLHIALKGAIKGASAAAYVLTSDTGRLIMNASHNITTIFPVGTLYNYLPATISLNAGSDSGTIGLTVSPIVYNLGTTGVIISTYEPMVSATWLFKNYIGAGINANMALSWSATAQVNGFLPTDYAYISHYSSMWDDIGDSMIATLSGSLYTATRASITSMSPFAIFNQQTIPTSVNAVTKTGGDILIYPNPTSENLNIENTTGSTGLVYAEIYNTLGQVVSSFQFKDAATNVSVSGLANGIYFIKLYNDTMNIVKKFSKVN
jgi:hypothetical protein